MKGSFKKKSSILMIICFLIIEIRIGLLISTGSIFNLTKQKIFSANEYRDLKMLAILPVISILEVLVFLSLFIFVKTEKSWRIISVIMEVFLLISVFLFLFSIYNFA